MLIIRFVKLARLVSKVKKSLKENKYQIKSTRFGVGKAYVTAESEVMVFDLRSFNENKK